MKIFQLSVPRRKESSAGGGEFADLDFAGRKRLAARIESNEFVPMPLLEIVVGGARSPAVHGDIAARARGVTQQFRANVVWVFRKKSRPVSAGSVNPPESAFIRRLDLEGPENRPMRIIALHHGIDKEQLSSR